VEGLSFGLGMDEGMKAGVVGFGGREEVARGGRPIQARSSA